MDTYETRAGVRRMQAHELRRRIDIGERTSDLDLKGVELIGEELSGLNGDRLDLQEADLQRARFCGARLGSCHLQHSHMEESDWSNATARMCLLDGALAIGARFDGARLEDSSARGADFTRASLRGARLTETSFERAVLCEANLEEAEGDGVEFRGADLSGARLTGAKLDEADFRGANLTKADLSNGRFRDADFRGAILDDAVFAGADLEGALFDEDHDRGFESTTGAADDTQLSDDALLMALQKTLSELPGAMGPTGTPLAQLQSQLQEALLAMGKAADRSPDDLTPWLDSLVKMAMNGNIPDIREMLDGECDGFAELRELPATEGAPIKELCEKLQHFANALDGASDQPPEEWSSWLEPLVKMTEGGQSLDLDALIEAVSSVTRGVPPTQRGPNAARKKRSAGFNSGTRRRRKPPLR